jgi:dynein heavy chain
LKACGLNHNLFCTCRLSALPEYYVPQDGSLQSYTDYITILPTVDQPEVFGQHCNAGITSLITESRILCETLISLEVQHSASEGESKEEKVNTFPYGHLM